MRAKARPVGPSNGSSANGAEDWKRAPRHHDLTLARLQPAEPTSTEPNTNDAVEVVADEEWDPIPLGRRRRIYRQIVKPPVDRVTGACLLFLLSPLIAVVALGVRLRLGPGVLFRQRRIGLAGKEFTIYKFRTMAPDRRRSDGDDRYRGTDRRTTHKSEDDPRHTGFGRLLRKYSLDELPQLVNVVQGDMSLVGPRPELVDVAVRTGIVNHPRHLVRPGLTGLWQISPARGELIVDGLDLDRIYVETCGPLTDLRILVLTVPAVWRRTGS